ncbi:MAG: hypothetical protein WA869_29210 [Alloacidobacterium sp.]|jgi:hypothetical protein
MGGFNDEFIFRPGWEFPSSAGHGVASNVDMGTKPSNDHGAAITVKTWIVDEGDLRRKVKAAEYVCSVVSLAHCFSSIA